MSSAYRMVDWFPVALAAPILSALANHTDKFVISRYLRNREVGALIIFSALFSATALPIILVFEPAALRIDLQSALILATNDMFAVIALLLYLYALARAEASRVVPLYQTIPIFAFPLSYFALGETITVLQAIGAGIVILGSLLLAFEAAASRIRINTHMLLLMLSASFIWAANGVIYKVIALEVGFWTSTFWGFVGKVVAGILFLASVSAYRKQFLQLLRSNPGGAIGLTSLSECMFIAAECATQYALIIAPVTLVLLVSASQPVFVLLVGLLLATFAPLLAEEKLARENLRQKCAAIGLIVVGSCLLI